MSVRPSHLYLLEGRKRRRPEETLANALAQAAPLQARQLPPILTLGHLAYLVEVDWKYLRWVVERKHNPYKVFQISKRQGGKRVICVPDPLLMKVQRWLHQHLLAKVQAHWRSFAFTPGTSIVECAREHCGCRWLIKLDVRQFFESVSEKQVYKVFLQLGYQPLVSLELARICTRQKPFTRDDLPLDWSGDYTKYKKIPTYSRKVLGHLPQGAPTSPILANLASTKMDNELYKLAWQEGLVYTRYADDLTFSTIDPDFTRERAQQLIRQVKVVMRRNTFEPHTAKTVIAPPGARKLVLGLLVDRENPHLPKDFRHRLEKHIWAIERFGLINHARHLGFKSVWGFKRHIEGKIAFAKMVDPEYASALELAFSSAIEQSGWRR